MHEIALVGAGRIGRVHALNIPAEKRLSLKYVVDPVADAANALARAAGAATASLEQALDDPAVAGMIIASSTDTHLDYSVRAVRAGKKVFCEKPIDLDLDRALDARDALADAPLLMGFNRRFDPHFAALRGRLHERSLGTLETLHIISHDPAPPPVDYVRVSGGLFRDMTIHDFDMARWLLGEEPVEVAATGSRLVDPGLAEFDDFDTVMVQMRTASGRQCHINCCREAVFGYDQRMEVFGSEGMLLNENLRATTVRRWGRTETEVREPLLNFFLERYADAYRTELALFIAAVETGGPMPVTPRDGRQALRLADCALEAALTGRTVAV